MSLIEHSQEGDRFSTAFKEFEQSVHSFIEVRLGKVSNESDWPPFLMRLIEHNQ